VAAEGLFHAENEVERALVAALRGERGPLLAAVAEAELYLPAPAAPDEGTRVVARAGDEVPLPFLERDGIRYVPAFTSETRFREFAPAGGPYMRIRGRELASIVPQRCSLALNPGGAVGLALEADEVARLRDVEAEPDEQFAVGEPREEPTEILDAMRAFAERTAGVEALYRCLLVRTRSRRTQLVIGLEVAGSDAEPVLAGAARAARGASAEAEPLSFLLIGRGGPNVIEQFLLERTRPFWVRD
jgi:SseB protein N-terminal domain/SseB protein C-terminal domain